MSNIPPLPIAPGFRISHVEGHRGYAIRDDGSVLSCRTTHRGYFRDQWHTLEPVTDRDGYKSVKLDGRRVLVHHLVLNAFYGPCPPRMEARHLDGDPANNWTENLRWGTRRQNQADREQHGTDQRGEKNPNAKLGEHDIVFIRDMRREGMSQSAIAREMGVRLWTIQRILRGEGWTHVA